MTNVTARIKTKGKEFEILVDVYQALRMKKGEKVDINNIIQSPVVFNDIKKGLRASEKDLQECFATSDINVIAEKIIRNGEVQLPKEYKEKEQENRIKQIVDFLSKNAIDPRTDRPYSIETIKNSIESSGIKIDSKPVESQISEIITKLRTILPIKIETKKISVKIPAIYTGKVYGLLQQYKEKEEWLNDGSLLCVINLPSGLQMDFYDKLNSVTHGNAITEEIRRKE